MSHMGKFWRVRSLGLKGKPVSEGQDWRAGLNTAVGYKFRLGEQT